MSVCRRGSGMALALLLAGSALAGCGDEQEPTPAAVSTAPGVGVVTVAEDGVQEITVQTQDDYTFIPDRFTVDPGRVRLTVLNVAEDMTHNLEFSEGGGPAEIEEGVSFLAPGDEQTVEFEVTVPGDYQYECTFHLQLNQVGTMTVRSR